MCSSERTIQNTQTLPSFTSPSKVSLMYGCTDVRREAMCKEMRGLEMFHPHLILEYSLLIRYMNKLSFHVHHEAYREQ